MDITLRYDTTKIHNSLLRRIALKYLYHLFMMHITNALVISHKGVFFACANQPSETFKPALLAIKVIAASSCDCNTDAQ